MSRREAARIVDANLNRCREGLRCAEEYARFALGDRGAAAALRVLNQRLLFRGYGHIVHHHLILAPLPKREFHAR